MKSHELNIAAHGNTPAYLANGLVGLRIGQIPLPRGQALVGGFVGVSPEKALEEYNDAPYPVGADVYWKGGWVSERLSRVEFVSQHYDFSCGELISRFNYFGVRAEVLTFCCRTQPTLVLQEVVVEVDEPGQLVLEAHIDQRNLMGRLAYRCAPARNFDGVVRWESRGGLSSVGVAYLTEFVGDGLQKRRFSDHEEDIELTEYHIAAKPGQRYVLRQFGALVPSLMHGEPHWQAARHAGYAQWNGFDKLRADNRAAWAELWKGAPRLVGASRDWQDLSDAAFFYLHSSASASSPASVAPFGLSQRAAYSGHVFWDTDTFMMPALMLSAPDTARAMMKYRSRCLIAAEHNAQLNGLGGVQFPWQSGNQGWEVTPYYALGGMAEHHVNCDVAFAMAQYIHATGDELFFRQHAWPVIQGVADWIASRVTKTARGYEIRHVTGPDEYYDNIHNNAFTNIGAIVVMREAIGFAKRLGFTPPASWTDIAERMVLPIDPKTNVMLKHDGYVYDPKFKGGICIPEPLIGFFPFGYRPDAKVEAATYGFHDELADTYLGLPMFSSLAAVWAARGGNRPRALQVLEAGFKQTARTPHLQFLETSPKMIEVSGYGEASTTVFLTNAAGFLMACYLGLPGLHPDAGAPADWCKHPVALPEGWDAIEIERVWIRGQPMRLHAKHGAPRATLETIS